MLILKNKNTGQIAEFACQQDDSWTGLTTEEQTAYEINKESKEFNIKKEKKKAELRKKHIDSQIQIQLDAVDNTTTEEELNNIGD